VDEEHARVAPALGAYAAGALEPGEAAEVEAHLAACAACRAEADQLGRAAAWLGAGQELVPPERLRGALLAAARAHPTGNGEPPGAGDAAGQPPSKAGPAAEALAAATADLDELLAGLTAEQWRLPVVHGWDVDELLRHLAAAQPPAAAGPDAALRQAFETWIHADDLRAALGRPPSPPGPDHLHGVLAMGMRLLPPAVRALGVERPGRTVALRLEGPGGGTWTVPPPGTVPPAATITAPATEFFYLMGNRRDPAAVATAVTGDRALAAGLLRAAATLGCD
jgi:Putative zinc-finger/Mycothiol maleylpyruvate isomerase N-terminal domain